MAKGWRSVPELRGGHLTRPDDRADPAAEPARHVDARAGGTATAPPPVSSHRASIQRGSACIGRNVDRGRPGPRECCGREPVSGPRNRQVLVVEDDPRLGPLLVELLDPDWAATVAPSGEEALDRTGRHSFDVLIVDRALPGIDGIALIRELRRRHDPTPILILSAAGTVADKVAGLDAGANDYLSKPFALDELTARLRALTRDDTAEGDPLPIGGWTLYPDTATLYSPSQTRIHLTDRENALLTLLARSPTVTISRQQIHTHVFPATQHRGVVDTYVHYLRRKTEPDLIRTIRGEGYRIGNPAP